MIKKLFKDETGASVIEVAIIIVILVVLAMLFSTEITKIFNDIIDKLSNEIAPITGWICLW